VALIPADDRGARLESDVARMRTDMSAMKSDIERLGRKVKALSIDWDEWAWRVVQAGTVLGLFVLALKL
jgi:3-phenylpropionate/cinnamic acid dioxygenase small subunit